MGYNMKITFTGRQSQIGEYIKGDYDFVSYDLADPNTWKSLLESDVVFLLLPKKQNTLELAKHFIIKAMDSKIKQIYCIL